MVVTAAEAASNVESAGSIEFTDREAELVARLVGAGVEQDVAEGLGRGVAYMRSGLADCPVDERDGVHALAAALWAAVAEATGAAPEAVAVLRADAISRSRRQIGTRASWDGPGRLLVTILADRLPALAAVLDRDAAGQWSGRFGTTCTAQALAATITESAT